MNKHANSYANGDIQWGNDGNRELSIISTNTTIAAYLGKKYLNEPWERFKKGADFWLKFTAVASLGISLYTTISTCNKSQDNKQDIQRLQQQVDAIKGKTNTLPQSKK